MRHLTEEQLVGLVLEHSSSCPTGRRRLADSGREHLAVCPECRAKSQELRELTALLAESSAVPPVSAWSQLKGRMERSRRPGRDWREPRWVPLVVGHLAVVVAVLSLILALGGWLQASALWERIGTLEFVGTIGPRGLVALLFLAGGGLSVLALTPILWWESRNRG